MVKGDNIRRVVTAHGSDGGSYFARRRSGTARGSGDGPRGLSCLGGRQLPVRLPAEPWPQGATPGPEGLEAFLSKLPPESGLRITIVRYQPGWRDETYAVDTADVVIVLDGELVYALDNGEEMTVSHGDIVVQSGVAKSWSNRSDRPAMIAAVVMGAVRDPKPAP